MSLHPHGFKNLYISSSFDPVLYIILSA